MEIEMGGPPIGGGERVVHETTGFAPSMGNATGIFSRDAFSTILERQPVERVRAALDSGEIHPKNVAQAREWLAQKEADSAMERMEKEDRWREREIVAAEAAAEAAKVSADEARRNSRIAMAAAFIAMLAAIISLFKS
jgi:hypothetical protein